MRILKMLCALVLVGGCANATLSEFPKEERGVNIPIELTDPVWVDGDFGCGENSAFISDVDDCAALLLLKRSGVHILGISTASGNVSEEESFAAVQLIAEDTPIYRGKDKSCDSPAVSGFRKETAGIRVVLFALAPLTNVATFVRCGLGKNISRIVFVGGRRENEAFVLNPEYTSIPLSDMNVRKDPSSAKETLGSPIPITLVPFEAGKRAQLSMRDLRAAGVVLPSSVEKAFARWDSFVRNILGASGMPLWDMHAVSAILWPDMFHCETKRAMMSDELIVSEGMRKVTYCLPKDPTGLAKMELRTLAN